VIGEKRRYPIVQMFPRAGVNRMKDHLINYMSTTNTRTKVNVIRCFTLINIQTKSNYRERKFDLMWSGKELRTSHELRQCDRRVHEHCNWHVMDIKKMCSVTQYDIIQWDAVYSNTVELSLPGKRFYSSGGQRNTLAQVSMKLLPLNETAAGGIITRSIG
jgi:hypothetical protein